MRNLTLFTIALIAGVFLFVPSVIAQDETGTETSAKFDPQKLTQQNVLKLKLPCVLFAKSVTPRDKSDLVDPEKSKLPCPPLVLTDKHEQSVTTPNGDSASQGSTPQPEKRKFPWTPVFSGYATAVASFRPGMNNYNFDINPILYIPVGEGGLFLTEWEFKLNFEREDGITHREVEHELEYLQFNQRLSPHFTGVVGKFLTPGMFNERLHPSWIKKTQEGPFTAGLLPGNGVGGMLRGAVPLGEDVNFTYTPFFTTGMNDKHFGSQRMVGGRIGTFFKNEGLDLGLLVARLLQGERTNIIGIDGTYQMRNRALDFRGEFYRQGEEGSAYWFEVAKRFKNAASPRLRKLEIAGRFEQAFVRAHNESEEMLESETDGETTEMEGGDHGTFPKVNTNRFIGSVNYYFRDGAKLFFAYGREIVPGTGQQNNLWSFGMAYRFLK